MWQARKRGFKPRRRWSWLQWRDRSIGMNEREFGIRQNSASCNRHSFKLAPSTSARKAAWIAAFVFQLIHISNKCSGQR